MVWRTCRRRGWNIAANPYEYFSSADSTGVSQNFQPTSECSELDALARLSQVLAESGDLDGAIVQCFRGRGLDGAMLVLWAHDEAPLRVRAYGSWNEQPILLDTLAAVTALPAAAIVEDKRLVAARLGYGGTDYGLLVLGAKDDVAPAQFAARVAERVSQWLNSNPGPLRGLQHSGFLNAILEQMAEGVLVADDTGKFRFFNPQAQALLGSRPDLSPHQWSEHYSTHRPDPTGVLRPVPADQVPMVRALGGERVDGEEYFLARGGRAQGVWLSINSRPLRGAQGEVLGAVSVCRDITDYKRAQQDFRRVIEASRDGVGVHRGGHWVYVNPALLDALGYGERDELQSIPIAKLLHSTNGNRHEWLHDAPDESASQFTEMQFLRQDGESVTMEVSRAKLADFEGSEAMLVTFRNVTERKKLESQLMISDRMASLGTLAAGVGHEINNPLAAVRMNLELAVQQLGNLPPSGELTAALDMLGEALGGADRVRDIVHDLKIFSRAEATELLPTDLHSLMDSTLRMAWNDIRHRATLVKDYAPDLRPVLAVESRLGQVILNLLMNAAQAIPEGQSGLHRIVIRTFQEGDWASFSVQDTGQGISPEVMAQMFTPFFSTKSVGEGSGLGLSLSHRIVADLGGTLSVSSEPGLGATFTVRLPAQSPTPAPISGPPRSTAAAAVGRRVLVVDDEESICQCVKLALGRQHLVDVCSDGAEALERLRHCEPYDLILCDLMMPKLSGIQLFEIVQQEAPEQSGRFVFMTGGAFTPAGRAFLDNVSNVVLQKPYSIAELRAVVAEQLAVQSTEA